MLKGIYYFLMKTARTAFLIVLLSVLLFMLFFNTGVSAVSFGDVNTDSRVNVQDVVLVTRHVLGFDRLSETGSFIADVNGDGIINVQDVSLIMQKSLGMIETFQDAPKPEPYLLRDFIVGDDPVTPGMRVVVVTLDADNPEHYIVMIGDAVLNYSDSLKGHLGEVNEDDAVLGKVVIYRFER
ncbi:MAG: dockerin type I repeat-containing protein [Bacillota bacterium]